MDVPSKKIWKSPFLRFRRRGAFTLIELLLVIAIIGIMSALIVAAIVNAASDSRSVLARQQQTVVQEALNSWISRNSSEGNSLQDAKATYNATANRLALVSDYLDAATYAHFSDPASASADVTKPRTEAMMKTGQYLLFTDWTAAATPRVNMVPE